MSVDNGAPCPLCGEKKPELFKLYFDGYVKLYRCLSCSFVSQYPGPGSNTLVMNYENRYSLDFLEKHEFMYPYRKRNFQDIVDRILKLIPCGKIFDVGCGDGHFLYLCSERGLDCFGVEYSKDLASYASSKVGANIVQGPYNKEMYPKDSFDVITFIQVIEHIPKALEVLATAFYHLRPGGLVVIEVPSILALHFLAYRFTGIKWFVKPPHGIIYSHCGYYTPKTMIALTEKSGFKMISIVTGRWKYKYSGALKSIANIIDPIMNMTRIGGILYIGRKVANDCINKNKEA